MGARIFPKKMVDQDVWSLAIERIEKTYSMCDDVVVSFSGGKDSTCILHATEEVARRRNRLPLKVLFWDEEAIPMETIDYVSRIAALPEFDMTWMCVPVKHRNACSRKHPYWYPWAEEDREKWCRPLPAEGITELKGFKRQTVPECNHLLADPAVGITGMIVGLRAAESLRRYRAVAKRSYNNFISVDSSCKWVRLSKPIYDWTTEDVWTAHRLKGWDHNTGYDTMEAAGISRHNQRVCPPYGEEPLRGLYQYSVCWPDLWEKMIYRVHGAATAARYSRSPLYGFGELAGWSLDANPKELIEHALAKWPSKMRAQIASRVRSEIKSHYQKDSSPIPMEEEGSTGVTWRYLYMLALRGDIKGRRTPNYKIEKKVNA